MKPTIGNWYRITGSDSFEVVAFDEDDGTIELQYFDGTVEEMDLEDWQAEHEAARSSKSKPLKTGPARSMSTPKKTTPAPPRVTTRKTTGARARASSKASTCSSSVFR